MAHSYSVFTCVVCCEKFCKQCTFVNLFINRCFIRREVNFTKMPRYLAIDYLKLVRNLLFPCCIDKISSDLDEQNPWLGPVYDISYDISILFRAVEVSLRRNWRSQVGLCSFNCAAAGQTTLVHLGAVAIYTVIFQ